MSQESNTLRRAVARVGGALSGAGLAALTMVGGASPASAADAPVGCGYGTGGPSASTLCWLDMSAYNNTQASSAAGQNMKVTLPGGYTMTFNIVNRPAGGPAVPVAAFAVPTNGTASAMGNRVYKNIPGKPALYTRVSGANTLTLRDIVVTDSGGARVSGYALVGADAENTGAESITWNSNQPINQVASVPGTQGCQASTATGFGTNTVTCTGTGGANTTWGTLVVNSVGATTFSQTLRSNAGIEAVAFAVQTSKLTLNKQVTDRRQANDSFDISVTSPEGTTVGTAGTGLSNTATTGALTVLPRAAGQGYTLGETGPVGNYDQSWACTNATAGSATPLPSGTGTSVQVSPQPGDDISCTLTNTGQKTDLSLAKEGPATAAPGDLVTYRLIVTNHGPGNSTGYTVSDRLPAGLTGITTTTPGCTVSGLDLTCTGGELAAGDSAVIEVSGIADGSVKTLYNTAVVKSNEIDTDPTNDTSNEVTTDVVPMVSLAVAGGVLALGGGGYALKRRRSNA
ncbi:DUF11 domain-containing protein [Amycolatopsis thermoflava]|uniref:DUF11 domain-containing protein n=1 Tax=Amycolatopsis thermoflava TaxID=84480 RepID=UPI0038298048